MIKEKELEKKIKRKPLIILLDQIQNSAKLCCNKNNKTQESLEEFLKKFAEGEIEEPSKLKIKLNLHDKEAQFSLDKLKDEINSIEQNNFTIEREDENQASEYVEYLKSLFNYYFKAKKDLMFIFLNDFIQNSMKSFNTEFDKYDLNILKGQNIQEFLQKFQFEFSFCYDAFQIKSEIILNNGEPQDILQGDQERDYRKMQFYFKFSTVLKKDLDLFIFFQQKQIKQKISTSAEDLDNMRFVDQFYPFYCEHICPVKYFFDRNFLIELQCYNPHLHLLSEQDYQDLKISLSIKNKKGKIMKLKYSQIEKYQISGTIMGYKRGQKKQSIMTESINTLVFCKKMNKYLFNSSLNNEMN
ncbi:hypothetical protein TTHERM_01256550 (macronuclear) [Tetrahymena thermophila SB210]|uniref:Uncharacterized protein n=1 Tax=Tetrahymena thermophila (strain SB210) TaxID=312017 RepID=Q239L2_TETTS|nr:hypothetical protein TTHERM_01256550 [Tetrahymena thermophila SB210]EAR93217.2 hypothetical protein TTHERM_01256550 [Tetrahymena thermophila SB210]|eukprot:XP_001013462.2 hypothetical protein TTHERM_01256550 [Tetrahymena thermophila SB210]